MCFLYALASHYVEVIDAGDKGVGLRALQSINGKNTLPLGISVECDQSALYGHKFYMSPSKVKNTPTYLGGPLRLCNHGGGCTVKPNHASRIVYLTGLEKGSEVVWPYLDGKKVDFSDGLWSLNFTCCSAKWTTLGSTPPHDPNNPPDASVETYRYDVMRAKSKAMFEKMSSEVKLLLLKMISPKSRVCDQQRNPPECKAGPPLALSMSQKEDLEIEKDLVGCSCNTRARVCPL